MRHPHRAAATFLLGAVAALAFMLPMGGAALAQTGPSPGPSNPLVVPTTHILALGSFTAKSDKAVWMPIMPAEVRATVQLYLDGKIDQWWVKQDQSGVVFILNVTDPAAAHAMLEALPLGRAGQMEFTLVPVGPLSPLRALMGPPK